ncbi:MAG: DUF2235 domain-containing protein [Nostoc sp. DedSLP03]|uniref:DUF2235 domain-containing protein n=1 Tax=Nostoc sp. DedSLP03 TaxID=3075400 RepID=UPI002AD56A87|nr:DUF2235 domain-containing protein [Nostoc sp. DedSLP03]MDZ7969797.1 DUF2235 domain-containing protein [Nostoc sp. DedSLP03]
MKRLIICCDGTWQKLTSPYPTNVVKIAQAIKPSSEGISQIVFYDEGVGAGNAAEKALAEGDKILGGAFGLGIDNNIQNAYRFLCLNYEQGDEIYLFGFSRGAYTVRSLAGLIRCSGGLLSLSEIRKIPALYEIYRDRTLTLKEKEKFLQIPIPKAYGSDIDKMEERRSQAHKIYSDRSFISLEEQKRDPEKSRQDLQQKEQKVQELLKKYHFLQDEKSVKLQEVEITLIGCWDTVGSLGVPNQIPFLSGLINEKFQFHDTLLSSIIKNALHAVAIDEIREVFDVTHMKRQNDDKQPLLEIWFPGAHGCVGGGSKKESGLSDATLAWMMEQINVLKLGLKFDWGAVEDKINLNHKIDFDNTLEGIYKLLGEIQREIPLDQFAALDDSTKRRWRDRQDYRPKNLRDYANDLNNWKE